MKTTLFIGLTLAACGITPLASGQMPNLVVGGDFESVPQGSTGSACHSSLLPSVPGWSSNRGYRIDRLQNLPSCIDSTINPFNPMGGLIFLSLQGSVCCGCNNNGWIEQTLATESGKRYRISFEAALDYLDTLQVKAGAEEWIIDGTPEFLWATFEVEFIATGNTVLRFTSMSPNTSTPPPGGGCWEAEGCHLDNIQVREAGDCDNNGISDADEIAAGVPDCNQNGIPDNCDYEGLYVTPQQAPFGAGNFLSHTFTDVDLATEDVSVMVEVRADLDSTAEFATLKIDGETIDVLWPLDGEDCPAEAQLAEYLISAGEFNALAKDGEVTVTLEASPLVSAEECPDSFARVSIQYATTFPDCNGNGLDDNCEIADGTLADCDSNGVPDSCDTTFADCNANGVPDSCDISDGTLADCNGNGQPDSCEVASWPDLDCDGDGQLDDCQLASDASLDENEDGILDTCSFALGDFDLDGVVGGSDLAFLLALWGAKNPPVGDLTGDGLIDGADLANLLGNWGPYQGVWGSIIEILPDPAVVTDPEWRERIIATGHPWRVRHKTSDIEMLLVPPGTFMMGCSPSDQWACGGDENPVHEVTLTQAFYLGRYEVTQAQWTAAMGSNPSAFQGHPDSDLRPVEQVSWVMVADFNALTGFRLPTEAEWEYACRAGTQTAFNNGGNDASDLALLGWYSANSDARTHAVGEKMPNRLGLFDMHGNIQEWCADWFSATYYSTSPGFDPIGPATGEERVVRGGRWATHSGNHRSSRRLNYGPESVSSQTGFRVARTP